MDTTPLRDELAVLKHRISLLESVVFATHSSDAPTSAPRDFKPFGGIARPWAVRQAELERKSRMRRRELENNAEQDQIGQAV